MRTCAPPTLAMACVLLLTVATAMATVPAEMNYQVMLTNALDEPLVDQSVTVIFRLYDDATAGSQQWTETHSTTTNSIGVVSVILGETSSLASVDFSVPLWLEVDVDGETLLPRRKLASSPYALQAADSDLLGGAAPAAYSLDGHTHDGRYYTESELNTSDGDDPNVGSNAVSWDNLTDVPAGFADGSDATGGSGDGHSLDAVDGSPADVVYVDGDGVVAVQNTYSPRLQLKSSGGGSPALWFYRAALGQYDYRLVNELGTMRMDLSIDNGDTWTLMQHFGHDGSLGLGRLAAIGTYMLDVGGSARIAGGLHIGENSLTDVRLDLYQGGSTSPIFSVHDALGAGGRIEGRDPDGNSTFDIRPDISPGGGGELRIRRNSNEDLGFMVNGNPTGTEATSVGIYGPDREILFQTQVAGDASVDLPDDAISADEVLDEPGGASTYIAGASSFSQPLCSATITAPADGYALVIATANIIFAHTASRLEAELSLTTNPAESGVVSLYSLSNTGAVTAEDLDKQMTLHGIFEATEGENTYYLRGLTANPGDVIAQNRAISVIFIPTLYGDIDYPAASAGPSANSDGAAQRIAPPSHDAQTLSETATEGNASLAANQERIERELAEMRERMARMEAALSDE